MNAAAKAVAAGCAAPLLLFAGSFVANDVGEGWARSVLWGIVPLLMALAYYPTFSELVARGETGRSVRVSLLWALTASVTTIAVLVCADPRSTTADALIWNAHAYRVDMFHWIETGIGQEGSPRQFVPQHALHAVAFAVLTLVSRGFLGLALGAALLNYMNAYVSALLSHGNDSARELVLLAATAWPAYALVRVVGFICIATALSVLVLTRKRRSAEMTPRIRTTLWIGLGLVASDLVLKAVLAPAYRELFLRITTLGG